MTCTTSATLLSIAMLPILALVTLTSHSPEAHACGNSMKRVIKHKPTTMMASEYFEEHAYLQAAATAFDAHKELHGGHHVAYTLTTDDARIRAARIAALAIIRLHGVDQDDILKKATGLDTTQARLDWAQEVLAMHHQGRPDDLKAAVHFAEVQARSEDPDTLRQAFVTLSLAAELDLMPDAHAWATLAALQRLIGVDDADAVSSCQAIGSFNACPTLSITLSETPSFAAHTVKDKRREVIRSRSKLSAKKASLDSIPLF